MERAGGRRKPARFSQRLLPAKISVPRTSHAIPRARVFRLFDRALSLGAVWVAGAPGAGKTTAIASYLAARRRPAVWYDVDPSDTDVANLFVYLARAVRATTRARRELPTFQVQHLVGLRAFARRFFEAVFAALPAGSTVVLDNCHHVSDDPTWAEILAEAVLAVPAARNLVLVSRAEPPAALSRPIVNDRLAQVTGADLRFSAREALALARARAPARLRRSGGGLTSLCALADGWPAGLVLALDHAARGDTAVELARRDGRLFEYFSSEILSQLPPEAQRVLLATALLPCMTERMAVAVSGNDSVGALLAQLHRRGLLIERLPTAEVTYRYHPLLRAFLLARADVSPAALARAAAACAAGGFLDEAVELYARAGADADTATLVLTNAPRLIGEGRYRTLSGWIGKLSPAALASQPWLRYWQATVNIAQDQQAGRAQFEQAFLGFESNGDTAGLYLSIAGAIQLVMVESEDFRRLEPWCARLSRILAAGPAAPSDDIEAAALTSAIMAAGTSFVGVPEAVVWAERALTLAPADHGARVRLWASLLMWLSNVDRLEQATGVLARLRPAVTPALDPLTRLMINQAQLFHSVRLNWRHGREIAERNLAIVRAEGLQIFEATYLGALAQVHAIAGDVKRATSYLCEAEAAGAGTPGSHLFRSGFLDLVRGTVSFAAGHFDSAIGELGRSAEMAAATGADWGEMLARALRRVALQASARHEEAIRETKRLTGRTEPRGIVRLGIDLSDAEFALLNGPGPESSGLVSAILARLSEYGSFGINYLRGLPKLVEHGLRDAARGVWLAGQIADHGMPPWPQHQDLAAWPWPLRVRALGGFALHGGPPAERSRKTQNAPLRLLKCIVAAGGEPLSVAAACDALWPDQDRTLARRNLDITLHRLRKLVGDDVVQLHEGALIIDRGRCFVDAWAFSSLAAQAERRLRRSRHEAAAGTARDLFARACQLYAGPLLPDTNDLPRVAAARESLRRSFVHLVLAFGAALERTAWPEAVDVYEQGVEIDTLAEPISQGLMRAYLALGRSADVANEYHRFCLARHAAGGGQPAAETRALYEASRARTTAG